MGREVRRVPANWEHPKYVEHEREYMVGHYIPLLGGDYNADAEEWEEGYALWQRGLVKNYAGNIEPRDEEYAGYRWTDYSGPRPSPDDYMPSWSEEQRTHFMMYEDTSEGTPISPAFATPEELAQWLADNGASTFADMTATYDQWLPICKGGWAPSMVIENGRMMSGVEAVSER